LARGLEARKKLLVAEVNAERAELLGDGGLQLGGIRYFTRESFNRIDATLGLQNSAGVQDFFLYVLHPTLRYQAKNYRNVFLPSNIAQGALHLRLPSGNSCRRLATYKAPDTYPPVAT